MSNYGYCPKCGEWRPLVLYWESRWCKECISDETARIQAEVEVEIESMGEHVKQYRCATCKTLATVQGDDIGFNCNCDGVMEDANADL